MGSIDKNKNSIPWCTYLAIEYLNNLDFSDKLIFEYGSGNSSSFWSKKSKNIVSIEYNKEWYEKFNKTIATNQSLFLTNDTDEYERCIQNQNKKFDTIVIDGTRRDECVRIMRKYLNNDSDEGAMIILDNSDWYKDAAKYLRDELNLIEIDFHGFGQINAYAWTTSIIISRNFNFKAINNSQPHFSTSEIRTIGV